MVGDNDLQDVIMSRGGCKFSWVITTIDTNQGRASRDHASVGYRVPKEWDSLGEGERGMGSLAGFKKGSRAGFLRGYAAFVCAGCYVCGGQGGQG